MASDRNPLMTPTRLVLTAQRTEELEDEEPTLDLLGLPAIEKSANLSRAGRGRPPGARNRTTRDWLEYLGRKYGSPLEVLAQMARAPTDQLAKELGCTKLEAYVQKRHAAESLAPFLHPKLSTVELYPPGHPMGPPSLLSLTPQDWAEIPDTVVEDVVEVSDAAESSPEAALARVVSPEKPAVDDDDNLETRVADDVVEQALDAVLLLASDPRYAEAIRRRLKALK
jgi:hypothetical protein